MKKRVIILLSFVLPALSLVAQEQTISAEQTETARPSIHERWAQNEEKNHWQIGMRLGGVASDMLYTAKDYKLYKHNPYARGTIGFWAERDLIGGLSIRPELAFTGRGVMLSYENIRYALKMREFDIRLSLIYTFLRDKKVQPYLFLTPNLNFAMLGTVSYTDNKSTEVVNELTKGSVNPFNISVMFGFGLRYPVSIHDFDFFINTEAGYNFGCLNTYSKAERDGTITPLNAVNSSVVGSRFSSNFELALGVGLPLSSFRHHERAPRQKVERGESLLERKSRERRERKAALEEQERLQAELLKRLQQQQENKGEEMSDQLAKFNSSLSPQNRVGNGIKMYVVPSVAMATADDGSDEMNLQLEFAYETVAGQTLKYDKNTDDYPAGAYLPTQSKACKATLSFMKEQLDGEMAKYLNPGTKVTIKITGETDGSQIRNKIPYKGEYGDFNQEMIYLNNQIDEMTVTQKGGITTNGQLGFLRTQGVQKYIETYIDALQKTDNTYQIYAVERQEKGSQYRKISVELTIHDAYRQEMRQMVQEKARQSGDTAKIRAAEEQIKQEEQRKQQPSDVDTNIPITNRNNQDSYVLIIGNEKYKDIVGTVPFAESDAKIFKQYCISTLGIPERQIRMALNATRNEINDGLDWLDNITQARQGKARIIVYYAGHGIPIGETTYLLPIDGNPEKANQQIALNELYARLSDWNAASVTCLFDACFSGTRRNGQPIVQGGRGVALKPKYDPVHGNLVIFSAADASQTAYPLAEQKHGMFTYFLLKALKESKGQITYQKLIAYLTEKVSLEASLQNRKQTPNLQYSEQIENEWLNWTF